jgi:hypothetical protein
MRVVCANLQAKKGSQLLLLSETFKLVNKSGKKLAKI